MVPFYNCENWIENCIKSILNQNYPHYTCIFIDDASNDKSFEIVNNMINKDNRFILHKNSENKKALANIVFGINQICDYNINPIILFIDGDDKLYSHDVLDYLNNIYQNINIWLTYGDYITLSSLQDGKHEDSCNEPLNNINEIFEYRKNFSHLKTVRYQLWATIQDKHLRGDDGRYIQMAWDTAFMPRLIYNAGINHIKYINKILYVYNNLSNNEYKKNVYKNGMHLQAYENKYIRDQLRKECNL